MVFSIGWGEFAAITGAFLFGLANVIYRSQREDIDALEITSLKTWESVPFLIFLILIFGIYDDLFVSLEIFTFLTVSVILGVVLGDLIYIKSQELIGVSKAFPIAMTFPFLTFVLEILFLNEDIDLIKGFAISVIIFGVILIGKSTTSSKNPSISNLEKENQMGILLAIFAAVFWAIGALTLKIGVEDIDPIAASLIRVAVASVILLPMVGVNSYRKDWKQPAPKTLALILIAGFFGMTLGALLYTIAIKYSGASTSAAIAATAPIITVPLSAFFLKEHIDNIVVIGTMFTVLGVIILIL